MKLVPDLKPELIPKGSIRKAIGQTLACVFYPEIILLLFLPLVISAVIVAVLFFLTAGSLASFYNYSLQAMTAGSADMWFGSYLQWFAPVFPFVFTLLLIALAFPLIIVCNLLITSVLTSSYLVKLIAKRDFPKLEMKGRARFLEGLLNSLSAVVIYLIVWLVTLPLWFIPGVQLVLPVLLTAWLNRRICTFDALTDFSTDQEFAELLQQTKSKGYVMGLVTAGFNYVPMAFFISPVFTMVAFIYFQLEILQAKRSGGL